MTVSPLRVTVCLFVVASVACRHAHDATLAPASVARAAATLSVPAEPTPVQAAGITAVVYEVHVANTGTRPLRLERVIVRAASSSDSTPIATINRSELDRNVKLIGARGAPPPKSFTPGTQAIVFVWLRFDSPTAVPSALAHSMFFADGSTVQGATIAVRRPTELVLAPPVGSGDWWMGLGPANTSEHRRAVIRVGDDTVPHLAQRFAIDWVKMDARGEYARDHKGRTNADWYGYGEPVRAVADARIVAVLDSLPDNVPGEDSRAVPMTVRTVLGNYVLLDLGPGQGTVHRFALYGHLKPGSVLVRTGDIVTRGQVLGAIGNSGNSDGPHLHFHVTEASDPETAALRSEGIPFLLDAFSVINHDPERVASGDRLTPLGSYRAALPVEGDVIRLGNGAR